MTLNDVVVLAGLWFLFFAAAVFGRKLGGWVDRQEVQERSRAQDRQHRRARRQERRVHCPRVLTPIPDVERERWRLN